MSVAPAIGPGSKGCRGVAIQTRHPPPESRSISISSFPAGQSSVCRPGTVSAPVSASQWNVATVAWPQKAISAAGVK